MSHADGLCQLPDGTQYYFEYNGTADMCCTRLYKEYDELHTNWRKDNERRCACKETNYEIAILSTSYARWHFLWQTTICEKCMCITGKIMDEIND